MVNGEWGIDGMFKLDAYYKFQQVALSILHFLRPFFSVL